MLTDLVEERALADTAAVLDVALKVWIWPQIEERGRWRDWTPTPWGSDQKPYEPPDLQVERVWFGSLAPSVSE